MTDIFSCLLCQQQASLFARGADRSFFSCEHCGLIFVPPAEHLSLAEEKSRYAQHQNSPEDAGYRRFLTPFMEALKERVSSGAQGLDFGCGPGPALATWLGQGAYLIKNFDPVFFPDKSLLKKTYDFVCLTEVLEHLHHPLKELQTIKSLLKPGGFLAVKTAWLPQDKWGQPENFHQWYYARDPTHVAFYSPTSLQWIADYFGWDLELVVGDLAFFKKIKPPLAKPPHN